MIDDCVKLTAYFAEHDRASDGRYLADALLDLCERHAFQTSVLLRGVEGFGSRRLLQTQRLLTLSEDLPLVVIGVDERERIERALPEATALAGSALVTLERARMLTDQIPPTRLPGDAEDATKLTIYCGRQERALGKPAFVALVDLLHRHGIAGANVLLGVDGTLRGVRQRAKFFARNAEVPLMIAAVGTGEAIASVLPALGDLLAQPLMTIERVQVCKSDAQRFTRPKPIESRDATGLARWQKLMVHAHEDSRSGRHPLHVELIRRLRAEGAGGATALRGIWGYHGDGAPRGDRILALRRRVPVSTVIIDTPANIQRWYDIVDEVSGDTGLVTCEVVPAFRAARAERGGLELAERHS